MITVTPLSELQTLLDETMSTADDEREETTMLRLEISILAPVVARIKTRSPEGRLFKRRPVEITDEPGHWDNSYPPKEHVVDRTDQRLLLISEGETSERPLTSDAYYDYEIVTQTPDVLVDEEGHIYHGRESGTASYGSYAAYPGTDNRQIVRTYERTEGNLDELRSIAETLRVMHHAA